MAAARFDQLPVSPAGAARCLVDRRHAYQDARAASDPGWADLERRRVAAISADGEWIEISDDWDVDDGWEQKRLAASITPDPAWVMLAEWVAERLQLWRLVLVLERAHQKAVFGWHEYETMAGDRHLSRIVGRLLFAEDQLGWGWCGSEYPTAEAWHEELVGAARTLAAYGAPPGAAGARPSMDEARRALHWTADHLDHLWD